MSTETCTRKPGTLDPRCRCEACRAQSARMAKARRVGIAPAIPADQAHDVLADRVRRGWEDLAIASATGLSVRSVHALLYRIRHGARGRLTHATAAALLAIGDPTAGRVAAYSTTRRLRALARAGWPLPSIARATGVPLMTLQHARAGDVHTVLATTWVAVRDLYAELADRPGPSATVAARAAAAAWEPPAAWDEETLEEPDDPTPVVDEVAVERAVQGGPVTLTPAERDLAIPRMAAAGMPDPVVGAVLGLCAETIARHRRRLGVPPVVSAHVQAAREVWAS